MTTIATQLQNKKLVQENEFPSNGKQTSCKYFDGDVFVEVRRYGDNGERKFVKRGIQNVLDQRIKVHDYRNKLRTKLENRDNTNKAKICNIEGYIPYTGRTSFDIAKQDMIANIVHDSVKKQLGIPDSEKVPPHCMICGDQDKLVRAAGNIYCEFCFNVQSKM